MKKYEHVLTVVQLWIMFVLIVWLWRISGGTHSRWWGWF